MYRTFRNFFQERTCLVGRLSLTLVALLLLAAPAATRSAPPGIPPDWTTVSNACRDGTNVLFYCNGAPGTIADGTYHSVPDPRPFVWITFPSERGDQRYQLFRGQTLTFIRAPDGCLTATLL